MLVSLGKIKFFQRISLAGKQKILSVKWAKTHRPTGTKRHRK